MRESWGGRPAGSRNVRWTKRMREAFLDHLAATCNVSASAAAIGVNPSTVYHKRRGDPAFVAQWEEALACGYQMLETRLVGHALASGAVTDLLPGTPPEPPIGADFAVRLLTMRRAANAGRRDPVSRTRKIATKAETDAILMKKLATIEARLKARP